MDRSNVFNIIHLSFSFVLIFISYGVTQLFQTSSDYSKDGAFAVGIVYLAFCLGSLALSPYLTRLLGVRLTLILASLTYVSFIAANIHYHRWALFITAFVLGIGAALFWTAQGVYVTIATNKHEEVNGLAPSSTRGLMNGIFFGFFCFNQTIGNLLMSYLFYQKLQNWIIFAIMTGIAGLGSISLVFLRPIEMPRKIDQRSFLSSLSILSDVPFLLLSPAMCYIGLAQGFIYAAIPPLIVDKSRKFFVFALYGLASASSSFLLGKLSDSRFGRLGVFLVGAAAHAVIFALLLTIWIPPLPQDRLVIFILLVIGLGVGDSVFTSQVYSAIAVFYGHTRPADAFACGKAFQGASTALLFIGQVYLSLSTQLLALLILLSVTMIALIYEHYGVRSLDTGKTIMERRKQNQSQTEVEIEGAQSLTASTSPL